jgi:hypothetical protein
LPLFLNSIISLSPLCLYTLRTTADGDSLTASAPPWSIYRRGQSTAEEERQRTQPGTAEARHTEARHSRRRQLHHIARKQGRREENQEERRHQLRLQNDKRYTQSRQRRSSAFSVCSFCFYGSITAAARYKGETWQQARKTGRDGTQPETVADTEGTRTATTTQQQLDTQKPGMAADGTASNLRRLSDPAQSDYTTTKKVRLKVCRYYPAPPPMRVGERRINSADKIKK